MESKQRILNRWKEEIKSGFGQLLPEVNKVRERIKGKLSIGVWLGGPGPKHELHYIRELIGELLREEKFEVHFSENYKGGGDVVSKELEEIEALHLAIILAITPGASAEAVEFAHYDGICSKLFVFVPEEYQQGFIVQSLFENHRLIAGDSFFSLEKLQQQHDSELAKKVVNRAIDYRSLVHRKNRTKELLS